MSPKANPYYYLSLSESDRLRLLVRICWRQCNRCNDCSSCNRRKMSDPGGVTLDPGVVILHARRVESDPRVTPMGSLWGHS